MTSELRSQPHVVVCVDDDAAILRLLRRQLADEPYILLTTESPAQALQWLADWDVSLLIADQRMPEMLGTELLRLCGQRSPATIRALLTGLPDVGTILEGVKQGGHWLLTKPWDVDEVRRIILDLLGERELADRQLLRVS